jgi:ketosteroid isomerase-like protein
MPATPIEQTEALRVLAVEDAYVAAELARDGAALHRLVDDRFVFNAGDGTTSDKQALIEGVLAMNMVGQTISERSVLVEDHVALVFGTTEMRFAAPGEPETQSRLRYTSTYVRREGSWRLLALKRQRRAP